MDKVNHRVTDEVLYLAADEEDRYVVAMANEPLDENNWFVNERVMMRYQDDIAERYREDVDFMDVSPASDDFRGNGSYTVFGKRRY